MLFGQVLSQNMNVNTRTTYYIIIIGMIFFISMVLIKTDCNFAMKYVILRKLGLQWISGKICLSIIIQSNFFPKQSSNRAVMVHSIVLKRLSVCIGLLSSFVSVLNKVDFLETLLFCQ
jgi:hypothetical protein